MNLDSGLSTVLKWIERNLPKESWFPEVVTIISSLFLYLIFVREDVLEIFGISPEQTESIVFLSVFILIFLMLIASFVIVILKWSFWLRNNLTNPSADNSEVVDEGDLPRATDEEKRPTSQAEEIVTKLQGKEAPLSVCLADALSLARDFDLSEMETFCQNELTGWSFNNVDEHEVPKDAPDYRIIDLYISLKGKINPNYAGWAGSQESLISYIESNSDEFMPTRFLMQHPISQLESLISDARVGEESRLLVLRFTRERIMDNPDEPKAPVFCYARTTDVKNILETVRSMLTENLVDVT